MFSHVKITVVTASVLLVATACGGSGSGDDAGTQASMPSPSASSGESQVTNTEVQDLVGELPAGNIASYGAITVGDDAGMASDMVAAFFKLDTSVSADSLTNAFNGSQTLCSVDDDDVVDFEEISVGFIPSFNGIGKQAISAGESILLSSDAGTFATIQSQESGSFLFYTLPGTQVLPSMPIPTMLQADIPGNEFPDYPTALMPSVGRLENVDFGGDEMITSTSKMTWTPSVEPGSLVRLFSSTAGGFFAPDGVTVTCLAPDTGSFEFPAATQMKLGADFVGGAPIVSRVAIRTETKDNSVLFLIRESFAD